MTDITRPWNIRTATGLALAALAVASVVYLATDRSERASPLGDGKGLMPAPGIALDPNRRFEMKGIRPPTVPADKAELSDDDEVIGVVANGKARAYQLKALYIG